MFSIIESRQTYGGKHIEGVCLTSDDKPVEGIANGSRIKEVNATTGELKNFQFDADTAEWIEITSEPGSGSGGCDCGSGMLTVLVTVEEGILGTSYETDHTAAEIYEAFPNVAFYSVVTLEGEGESSVPSETKILIRPIDVSKSGSSYHLDLANGTGSLEFFAESGDDPFMALDPGSGNVPINY